MAQCLIICQLRDNDALSTADVIFENRNSDALIYKLSAVNYNLQVISRSLQRTGYQP